MKRTIYIALPALCAVIVYMLVNGAGPSAAAERGEINSPVISTTIVISQVYGGGGGSTGTYMHDYVELKNISASPQSLNGLSLQYGSATGNFGSSGTLIFALPNVTLAPGKYYLVQLSTPGSAGAALPVAADSVTTNLSMSGTSGKVALVNGIATLGCGATATPCAFPNANIIDMVVYGAAGNGPVGNGEGGTTVNNGAALTSTQGGVRKTGGCTETDNNNADFDVVTAPVPRNSATAAATCGGVAAPIQHVVDYDGDGRTDFSVTRISGAGSGQLTWFNLLAAGGTGQVNFGIGTDSVVPSDYDGDLKTDIAVWRPALSGPATWYILQSNNFTVRSEQFGQLGDQPNVVADYNNDDKADLAVYRPGNTPTGQSIWFYRTMPNGSVTFAPWGTGSDFPAPGDYDGDGSSDFSVQRNNGGQAVFVTKLTSGPVTYTLFGAPTDVIVPGDYDGDGKTDYAVTRESGAQLIWFYLPSGGGPYVQIPFGNPSDAEVQGDYDGDGKTDIAIWRPNVDPTQNFYYINRSNGGGLQTVEWGQNGDYPVANYNTH